MSSAVTDQPTGVWVERSFPPFAGAPAAARALVTDALESQLDEQAMDEVRLVVSELVANAVRHAGTDLVVRVRRLPRAVRIEVADGSRLPPVVQPVSLANSGGRGMRIVDELTSAWGFSVERGGKTVWTERSC